MTTSLYLGREKWIRPVPDTYPITTNGVTTRALIVHEDKILLVYAPKNGHWWLPGGHLALGEDLRTGALREVHEETALPVNLGDLVFMFDTIADDHKTKSAVHAFTFVFAAHPVDPPDFIERAHIDTDPDHPGKNSKMRWFTQEEVAALPNVFPSCLRHWPSLIASRPKAYYGIKREENSPADAAPPTRLRISTRSVALQDDQVLMLTSARRGYYCAPGGRVELGEDPLAAADRELQEETGLSGQSKAVIAVDEFISHTHGSHSINLYITCALTGAAQPAQSWQDHDGGEEVQPRFLSHAELTAHPRAYPPYMAELAWPATMKETA